MKGFPILSVITWAPFVSAVVIMFFARHRPLLVRGTAVAGSGVSLVLSLWLYMAYDQVQAGFQFVERVPLVPALGISYELAVDGMSLLMVLLTAIIIFAGAFASWTVKERGQEFYALLLLLVTGVFGVFVSLDLFIFFLFYEIAVLPMYLLIGIWGSSGEVRPQGVFGWAFGLSRHVAIDRQNRSRALDALNRAAAESTAGVTFVIMPEGTRSRDRRLQPFKKGGFHLAIDTGLPILPVGIAGSERLMPKGTWWFLPARST